MDWVWPPGMPGDESEGVYTTLCHEAGPALVLGCGFDGATSVCTIQ